MNERIKLEYGFHAEYELTICTADSSVPSNLPTFCYGFNGPIENLPSENASAILLVKPKGAEPWLLKLSGFLQDPASHAEGIYACPSSNHFLAVVNCLGFYVDARRPENIQIIKALPIRKVERYLVVGLLLVMDFQTITAIGCTGILWNTKRLVQDGITIDQVTDAFIAGAGDERSNALLEADCFQVSTIDGSIISGSVWCE